MKKNSEIIYIHTEYIKLDQFLKIVGIAQTGGHAKEIIKDELVLVNGEICTMRGKKLREDDQIHLIEEQLSDLCYVIKNEQD